MLISVYMNQYNIIYKRFSISYYILRLSLLWYAEQFADNRDATL